jgi:hypothetical protein
MLQRKMILNRMATEQKQEKTHIQVDRYLFTIIDNSIFFNGKIYNRNFKIGGSYNDCVNVSISYENGDPISAKIPTLMFDPECSTTTPLDHGGTVRMIKTLLQHIHEKIPRITQFNFEDKSSIECATNEEIKRKKIPKRGTNVKPLSLYYFSIVYNGITWYEKYFKAKMSNPDKYKAYKERLSFLQEKPSFQKFLEIANPPVEQIAEIEPLFTSAKTYSEFFKAIPREHRCRILYPWITSFMEYYLQDVFDVKGWVIDVTDMNERTFQGGKRQKTTRKNKKSAYYLPKGRITNIQQMTNIASE